MASIKPNPLEFNFSFPYKRIRVFPDRDLRASILEMAMVDTRIMQRLRNTKQLGNSNVSYPTAEHSRFSHSLGVLYWTSKILTSLYDNHNSTSNKEPLVEMNNSLKEYFKGKLTSVPSKIFDNDTFLGITWFQQLVRLYGLLHDITHIPFGHTIEDQASLFERHDDDLPRLNSVFEMLKREVQKSNHFEDIRYSDEIKQIAEEYINLTKSMFVIGYIMTHPNSNDNKRKDWLKEWTAIPELIHKPLLMTYDIVSNTICADLMDYSLRDTLFASMPKTFDKALLTCMKVVTYKTTFYEAEQIDKPMYRLGVNISRKKVRHDIITAILDLLRIRYDLTEKVYYHHTKVITDAMLEKILRSLPTEDKPLNFSEEEIKNLSFTPQDIYDEYLGDEGFLILLEKKLKSNEKLQHPLEILNKMFRRNLYKAAFRINQNEPLSRKGKTKVLRCEKPEGRDEIEKEIIAELNQKHNANISEGDIIISHPPKKMQRKIAKALIEWTDGQIFTFETLPMEANYSNEVGILTERYKTLWSMTVYINPAKIQYIRLIESVCENKFDIHNESILKNYLKEKYVEYYETQDTMTDINHKIISLESGLIASKAAKGGSTLSKEDKDEILEDAYIQAINERKKGKKGKSVKPNANDTDKSDKPELNFEEPK